MVCQCSSSLVSRAPASCQHSMGVGWPDECWGDQGGRWEGEEGGIVLMSEEVERGLVNTFWCMYLKGAGNDLEGSASCP